MSVLVQSIGLVFGHVCWVDDRGVKNTKGVALGML